MSVSVRVRGMGVIALVAAAHTPNLFYLAARVGDRGESNGLWVVVIV